MRRMALVGVAAIVGALVAACGPATPGTPRSPGTPAPPSTAAHPHEPKTGPPILIPGRFTGPVPPGTSLQLRLALKPAASAQAITTVRHALHEAGLVVTSVTPASIEFTGTVAQIAAFFHVRLEGWRAVPSGPLHVVAATPPQLPPPIAAAATDLHGFYLPGQRRAGGRQL